MTADEQLAELGASVQPCGDLVVITMGPELQTWTPKEAQRFASWLAHAYIQAAGGVRAGRGGHALTIGEPR